MRRDRLRISSNGLVGHDARVVLVREGEPDVDLSAYVRGVEISVEVGRVNVARLDVLVDEFDIEAESEHDLTSLVSRIREYTQ